MFKQFLSFSLKSWAFLTSFATFFQFSKSFFGKNDFFLFELHKYSIFLGFCFYIYSTIIFYLVRVKHRVSLICRRLHLSPTLAVMFVLQCLVKIYGRSARPISPFHPLNEFRICFNWTHSLIIKYFEDKLWFGKMIVNL